MCRTRREESPSGYYHVMQRGSGKQILFEDANDYIHYLRKVEACHDKLEFDLVAYCLMNNHVHMLIRTENIETLSKMMSKVGTSYAQYYNSKYDHVGYVFQGRYLSEPICDERYLIACTRYIHNNPVKAGFGARDEYPWSSYNEYFGRAHFVKPELVLGLFENIEQFKMFSISLDDKAFMDVENDDSICEIGQAIMRKIYGDSYEKYMNVKQLCIEERNKILIEMKAAGLSTRQVELLTGVSRTIVRRQYLRVENKNE